MPDNDPLWYKDAVLYEVHVRAFQDSDGDGYGDFRGLTQKLDYLVDLGVTAVWLLPFYPSPLKDDGYDIADYQSVHPKYGKLDDFREFLAEAHGRGLKVVTELVLNHTSDQHPWFRRARRAKPGSPERDFYVWSDTPEKYRDARIIFKDFEPSNWTWDRDAQAYYWHRFYSHQPDLNFDNPAVWRAIVPSVDFWFDMGVDGMRLDAVPYLFEREGTNCENLPETHEFLKTLRKHVDDKYPNRMFLAEANQWPEDAVAYFGDGDECQMAFHFPLMPRLFMALHQEDRFPIHDIMAQTPAIPENCQWCMFLRNHDELTLEMVTDEERDYMYRAYAQDRHARINLGIRHRLAPLLRNDRRRIELMNALLFALPGTPVLYYGDEIGMGDNIYLGDRDGVRTPMQWSADRNAGFSRANPQRLYLPVNIDPEYHYETVNVEAQHDNPSSLLWWMKRLIALRKKYKAFGRGSFRLLRPDNAKVLAFVREYQDERILVVANLSRFVQYVQIDLREFAGIVPEEMFGRTAFPRIGEIPYLLTLGPHGFIWFSIPPARPLEGEEPVVDSAAIPDETVLPVLAGDRPLSARFRRGAWEEFEAILPNYFERRLPKADSASIISATVVDAFPISAGDAEIWILLVRIEREGRIAETISVPLTLVPDDQVDRLIIPLGSVGFARVSKPKPGILCNALAVPDCCRAILAAIFKGDVRRIDDREIAAVRLPTEILSGPPIDQNLSITYQRGHRNNLSIVFNESYILKTFRRVEEGMNPDLEIGRFLTLQPDYQGSAAVAGYIEYRRRDMEPATLAVLHRYVANQGTAWQHALDHLSGFFERVAAFSREQPPSPPEHLPMVGGEPAAGDGELWQELIGAHLDFARLLGQRTAELHLALADGSNDPAFAPESFGKLYKRSLYQSMRNLTGRLRDRLVREGPALAEPARNLAETVAVSHDAILARFNSVLDPAVDGQRIRCHGDYNLGQLLFTGKDFVVIDFEGRTDRTIGERRVKRSPLWDVAAMVRSLDYAAQSVLLDLAGSRGRPLGMIRPEDRPILVPWAFSWYNRYAREFVAAYLRRIEPARLLPRTDEARRELIELFLLEHALLEIDYELSERPDWAEIPLRAAIRLLGRDPTEPNLEF